MDTLNDIAEEVAACRGCPLHEALDPVPGKQHVSVPGRGSAPAEVMIVGEAPGVIEADTGEEFVGWSGSILDRLLDMCDLERESCFVTNMVKHRTPRNRKPKVSEARACAPFLDRQLALVRPRIIIAMGAVAAKFFDKSVKLRNDHGRARKIRRGNAEYFLIPMYHPAATRYDAEKWSVLASDFYRLDVELDICRAQTELPATDYNLVSDEQAVQLALTATPLGFDVETTSPKRGKYLAVQETEITGYSVSWAPSQAVFVEGKPEMIGEVLSSPLYQVVCHNTKFEYGRLAALGIPLENWEDTKLAGWLLQYHSTHLKAMTRQLLGRDPITYEQVTQGRDMSDIDPIEEPLLVDYGAADSDNALLMWPRLSRELKEAGLWDLYEEVEKPIIPILYDMERTGVLVDEEEATQVLAERDKATELAYSLVYTAGMPIGYDVGSSDQLASFFEEAGAPIEERTEVKQQLKTDEDTLLALAESGWRPELMAAILQFKSLRKTKSYAEQYLELRGPDGRLHPDFIQAGAAGEETDPNDVGGPVTGRFACRGPNLQNQPKRKGGEWVKRLRRCLIATPGWRLVAGDMSQEEVRIASLVTRDRKMMADMKAGLLIYKGFAENIYGRTIDKHRDAMEWNVAKQCVLSFIWGTGGRSSWAPRLVELDQEQGSGKLTLRDAERAYTRLQKEYADIADWRKVIWREAYEEGEVRDVFGRRRLVPKVYHPDRRIKMEGHREAMNFLIQGPASTIMKKAMIGVAQKFDSLGLEARILLTIHDEIVAECPEAEVDTVAEILYNMTEGLLPIELPIEVAVGKNWGEMEEYERVLAYA